MSNALKKCLMSKIMTAKATTGLLMIGLLGCTSQSPLNIITPAHDSNPTATISSMGTTTAELYDVTTFDVYAENQVIHILLGGKTSATNKAVVLRYIVSDDGGRNWSPPQPINDHLPATIASRGNDVQLAVNGKHRVALWQTQGELPGMGQLATAYSADEGHTWQQGANPATNKASDQAHSDLIADQAGNFHAVWLEDPKENGYQSLRYSRSANKGKTWASAQTLDDSTCSCCWNTFALSAKGDLNILYRDMSPRDMALLQSNNPPKSWQKRAIVGNFNWKFDGCPHTGGALTYAGEHSKQLHSLVWTGAESKQGLYHLISNDNGLNWSTPQKMGNNAVHGDIAAFDTQHVAAVWDEMGAEGSSIYHASSEDGGINWTVPKRISLPANSGSHPRLVASPFGYLAVWTEKPPKQPQHLAWQLFK
jgi:BNR repeat-like domain